MIDESAGRRAAAYWFADGLPDIVFGLMLFLFAAAGLLWRVYAPHPWINDFWLMVIGFGLFSWKGRAVINFLKARVTYPRTGYVQPPDEAPTSIGLTALSLEAGPPVDENVTYFNKRTVLVVFSVLYCLFGPNIPHWLAPIAMPALALSLYFANRRTERPYHWGWALILALTGLVFLWVDLPPLMQPLLSYLLAGAWLVAQGVGTLIHYLRANRYPTAAGTVRA